MTNCSGHAAKDQAQSSNCSEKATDLLQVENSQVCEAVRDISMLRTPGLLIDAQGPFVQRLSFGKLQALVVQDGYVSQGLGHIWVVRS